MRRIVLLSLTLLIGAMCIGLGIWQVGRLGQRRGVNRIAGSAGRLPVLVLDSGSSLALPPYRRAVLTGELDPGHEFILRNRLVRGVPAVLIVTPLRMPGRDTAVLVNRGYVPAPDAVDPGPADWSEPGRGVFHGVLLPLPSRGDGDPLEHKGKETWKSLDLRAMRARLPYPISDLYLLAQVDSADGSAHSLNGRVYPFRAELPPMDEGPHLMYAVQWFGIAAAVVAFGVVFVWRGVPGAGERRTANGERSAVNGKG